jgi:ABC-type nitrate/sulfonate/bicarbonate transport system permease component
MYAAILVVGIIGLGLGKALDFTSRRLLGWKRDI